MMAVSLAQVKTALGITGEYQDATLTEYLNEVTAFLVDAGIPEDKQTSGLVARGVSDLWNYGEAGGELSPYFFQRAAQLAYKS